MDDADMLSPMLWQLCGPNDGVTPEVVSILLEAEAVGTADEWASIGAPVTTDELGNPEPLVLDFMFSDQGNAVLLTGEALERARAAGEEIEHRTWSFVALADEEAEGLPRCTVLGVRFP